MTKKKSSKATTKKSAKKSASRASRAKKTSKKTSKKSPTRKSSGKKKASKKTAKKTAKKASSRKASAKKKVAKKTAKKSTASTAKKKSAAKKTAKKSAKRTAKRTSKKTAKKSSARSGRSTASKKTPKKTAKKTSKKTAKKSSAKTSTRAGSAASKGSAQGGKPESADASKSGRKGITIVDNKKNHRRPRSSAKAKLPPRPEMPSLLGPGSRFKGPLIPSGPKNAVKTDATDADGSRKKKTPFKKRQLDKFKEILLRKRAEVFGDLEELETGALRSGGSGSLSNLPQHHAEQGSDSADQNLSLNLAEADRVLIREIDAALERIASRTYGLCAMTGQPISVVRLEELPWAQYSIEAARRLERGHF